MRNRIDRRCKLDISVYIKWYLNRVRSWKTKAEYRIVKITISFENLSLPPLFYFTLITNKFLHNLVILGSRPTRGIPIFFMATCRSRDRCTIRDGMERRESTENRALWVGVAWIQYFLFLRSAPPSTFPSLSFSLSRSFLRSGEERGEEGPRLLRASPREDLVILVPDFIFGRCWVSDPEPSPSRSTPMADPVEGDSAWAPHFAGSALYSTSLGATPVNFIQYHILTAEDTSHRRISRLISHLRVTNASASDLFSSSRADYFTSAFSSSVSKMPAKK